MYTCIYIYMYSASMCVCVFLCMYMRIEIYVYRALKTCLAKNIYLEHIGDQRDLSFKANPMPTPASITATSRRISSDSHNISGAVSSSVLPRGSKSTMSSCPEMRASSRAVTPWESTMNLGCGKESHEALKTCLALRS